MTGPGRGWMALRRMMDDREKCQWIPMYCNIMKNTLQDIKTKDTHNVTHTHTLCKTS